MGTPIVICFANVIRADMHRTTITVLMRSIHLDSFPFAIAFTAAFANGITTNCERAMARIIIVTEPEADDLKAISQKLEVINLQLTKKQQARRKTAHWLFISLTSMIVLIAAVLFYLNSPYLGWNYNDPETAVLGTAFHSFEWAFVRVGPFVLIGAIVGIVMTRRKDR